MSTDLNKTSFIKIISIVQWICSIMFILAGLAAILENIIPGLMLIIIGIVLLPPVDNILSPKYQNLKLHPALAKTIIIIVLLIITGLTMPEDKISAANELYDNEKFEEAINKLKEIKVKDKEEENLKESLIKKYSDDLALYQKDKNLFYYNRINEEFKKENYSLVISIYEKVDKSSPYYEQLKIIIDDSYNKLNFSEDKKNYDKASTNFNKKNYQDAIEYINKISKYTEFYNKGLQLKTDSEKLLKIQTDSDNKQEAEEKVSDEKPKWKVGDSIRTEKFELKVSSISTKGSVGNYLIAKAPEGAIFIIVNFSYKNISTQPITTFSVPEINIFDYNGAEYQEAAEATSYYQMQIGLDKKVISEINPGITQKDAIVFEVSKELWANKGWKLVIDADDDIEIDIK